MLSNTFRMPRHCLRTLKERENQGKMLSRSVSCGRKSATALAKIISASSSSKTSTSLPEEVENSVKYLLFTPCLGVSGLQGWVMVCVWLPASLLQMANLQARCSLSNSFGLDELDFEFPRQALIIKIT